MTQSNSIEKHGIYGTTKMNLQNKSNQGLQQVLKPWQILNTKHILLMWQTQCNFFHK